MNKLLSSFSKIMEAYDTPYYKVHQKALSFFAVLGIVSNAFFYIFLEYFTEYTEYFWLRGIVIILFASLFLIPKDRELKKREFWYLEMVWLITLPIFFCIMLFTNGMNAYWTMSLLLAVTLYALLADPIKGLILYPVVYVLVFGAFYFYLGFSSDSMQQVYESFFATNLMNVVIGGLHAFTRSVFLQFEQKNDIIEANKLELIKRQQVAEKASKAKTDFLANMSHEIRTPLNSIIGFSRVLEEQGEQFEFPTDSRTLIGYIRNAGEHLTELINNVLDLSKIEAGKMELYKQPFRLHRLIESVYHLHLQQAQNKGLNLEFSIDKQLPEFILSDRIKLNQILSNLVANAIKFSSTGTISIKVTAKENKLLLAVSDEGIGISPDRQAAIFNSFEQADNTTTRRFGGSGLGLAISKKMAELLQGNITLISQPGKGSTFFVLIPYDRANNDNSDKGETSTLASTIPTDKQILIVEDDMMNQLVIKGMLAKTKLPLHIVSNGKEAVDYIKEAVKTHTLPDLVFMDLHMPVMDGVEALGHIRNELNLGSLPVVALTADALAEQKANGLRMGFSEYITKPIAQEELFLVLNQFLNQPVAAS
ncbi:MAG: hypothetical protein CMB80_21310 [Flammeovirgaceae bacterium]|nr:hypothetical protein [Flammeovirgaceae bacterium]MBE61683.1 hypothetical protein [Flammeovirgaceae bacterium]HCX24148.1 hypothetical protein [Cytophagales bacterium]